MAENNTQLEGMTQEEFNTYLDKLDKSFVEANGGIVAVTQQALTASGRQALDEKLKAFTENKTHQPTQNSQQAETPTAGSTPQAQAETPTATAAPQTQAEAPTAGSTPQTQAEAPVAQQSQPQVDPKEAEQQKLAADFKKLYGVDYTPENIDKFINKEALDKAEKDLTAKGASKALKDYSTEDLAKLQFTVRQAEFDSKYKEEPDKAIADRRSRIVANKDNMNDAILNKMERYASGDEKIESPHKGKKARDLTKDEKKIRHQEFLNYKKEKDSFNMLQENAPEELQKHCKGTLEKANRKVNPKDTYSKKELAKAGKYARRTLKYKAMEIKDTDGLWSIAKKTAQMKAFTVSRSAQAGIKKWWKEGKVGKFARGLVDNKLTRGVSRLSSKVANKIKLFPSRAKKAIGKFWKNKIADPAKKAWQEKIVDPTKKAWQEKVVTPYIDPAKKWVNDKVQWVKDNPKKVMAAAAMVATTGIGFALAGPAGGLAGAKIGAMAVGGAVLGYGAVKGAQWSYKKATKGAQWTYNKGVEVKNKAVNNLKTNLRESFEQDKGKVPDPKSNEEKEKANADLAYMTGRQVFNENSEQAQQFVGAYKKMITPEGNNGNPKEDDEKAKMAAVQLYQAMLTDKNKGGMGLNERQADALMTYFNGNHSVNIGLKDIKAEIAKDKINEQATGKPKEVESATPTPTEKKETQEKGTEGAEPKVSGKSAEEIQQTPPVDEQTGKTIHMQPNVKSTKAQARDDFKQLKSNSEFGDIMAYCQVKYAQGQKKLADDASKRIEKMITADKDKGGLGLDPEKDAKRIEGLKSYLYTQGVKNDKFIKPKDNQKNQSNEGKTISMAVQKKQEEMLQGKG